MKKDKFKLHIGDTLYEASFMYARVIEWEIVDIFVERYVSGYKTIVVVKSDFLGTANKFVSDVLHWYDIPEAAEAELQKKLDNCPFWKEKMGK